MATPQYVYHMSKVSKTYPGGKQVLKDISLSFLPGAKIGVVGMNGAGKSTLLKIMAGQVDDYVGEAWAADGIKVGYLPQEPELDPDKTVKEVVQEGVQDVVDLLAEFDEINAKFAEEMTPEQMDKLLEKQGEVQERLDALDAWIVELELRVPTENSERVAER